MNSRVHCGLFLLFSVAATALSQEQHKCDTTYTVDIVYDTNTTPRPIKCFKIPVTYYDYHVDGSNPDFGDWATSRWDQTGLSYANLRGWVDSTLSQKNRSPKRHPSLTNPFLDISWNIERLFTPWTSGTLDTFILKFPPFIKDTLVDTFIVKTDTLYDFDGNMTIWTDTITSIIRYDTIPVPDSTMISDTMFKNIVIEDSLTVFWLPNDITYDNTQDSLWTIGSLQKTDPINGRGFGNETDITQNTGYTFRLHNKIIYKGGEKIYFGGDDDLYLFINGKLALECGGFHLAIIDSLCLDSVRLSGGACLIAGQKYDLDIFFVERRWGGNFFMAGLSEFVNKGALRVDTMYDTLITYRFDTTGIDTIKCTGINSRFEKPNRRTFLGLNVPPSAEFVTLEYFTISGAKVMDRRLPLALANKSVNLPGGMYIIRVGFFDKQGKQLSKSSVRKMIARR